MLWFRAPEKLFGFTGLLLFLVRLLFPPDDFAGANHLHSYVSFLDFQLDVTGYGFFDLTAVVFLLSALAYYLISRLTNCSPNPTFVHVHFWPSLLFAIFAIFLVYQVSDSPAGFNEPKIVIPMNRWLTVFTWAFAVFLIVQVAFAISAVRRIWSSKKRAVQP